MMAEEGEAPLALLTRPDVEPHLELVFEAFRELSTDRHVDGMGAVGEIPFTAIDRWAARFGFDDLDEFDRLRRLVRGMDREYLSFMLEQRKRQSKAK